MPILSERLQTVIKTRPDWYLDQEFRDFHTRLFIDGDGTELATITEEKWQVVGWFADALSKQQVLLGDVKSGFNDDDRPGRFAGSRTVKTDTVIVHHTATREDLTIWELEALGLLRLYAPHFMDTNPNGFITFLREMNPQLSGSPLAPSSGHYVEREGKEVQSFVGYHFIIYPDGRVVQLLDKDHMAFHAGNLSVNKRSYGVAFVGDFSKKGPTEEAKGSFKQLVKSLYTTDMLITYLDGHTSVRVKGHTDCPGPWFEEFRNSEELLSLKPLPKAA